MQEEGGPKRISSRSPVWVARTRLASWTSWLRTAIATNSTPTVISSAVSDCVATGGEDRGRGWEPIALSTAIFSGTGSSSASGVASRLKKPSAASRDAYGLVSRSSRR